MMMPTMAKITMPMPTLPSSSAFFFVGFLVGWGARGFGNGCSHCGMAAGLFIAAGGGGVGLGVGVGDSGCGVWGWISGIAGAAGVGRWL